MIFIYIILVLVIYYLVDRKKCKFQNTSPESEEPKKRGLFNCIKQTRRCCICDIYGFYDFYGRYVY